MILFSMYKNINKFATSGPSERKFFGICRGVSVCTQGGKKKSLNMCRSWKLRFSCLATVATERAQLYERVEVDTYF
jgi:hypothetical protein